MGAASELSLKLLLLGEDRSASKSVKGLGDEVQKTGSLASKVGKATALGMGAIAGGLGAILKTGFDETKDGAAGTAQLAAGIKSTHDASGETVDGLNDLASSIQNYSGQTDDSIVKSEQLLLTFTNIKNNTPAKIFDQATKATADMAAKMGGDASGSAVLLGKALNDPIKGVAALSKVGVSFSDAQKAQIAAMMKTGNVAGAQGVILKELQTEFGGAAKAAGESLPGQMQRAHRAFEDVSQAVVTDLLPMFQALLNVVTNDLLPMLATLSQFWMSHKTLLILVVGVIALLVVTVKTINMAVAAWTAVSKAAEVATKAWALAQRGLNAVLDMNPIGLVVLAIVALIAIFVLCYTKVTWFRNGVDAAFRGVKEAVSAVINWVRANWPLLLAILTGPIGLAVLIILRHWTSIRNGATDAKNWIVNRFNDLVGFITGLPGRVGRASAGLFHGMVDAFRSAINWIISAWNGLRFSINIPSVHVPGTSRSIGGGSIGFGVPSIPFLAKGGIVRATPGGRLVGVAEGGEDEVVAPLSRLRSMLGGSQGGQPSELHLHVNGQVYGSMDDLARALLAGLQRIKGQGTALGLA